MPIARSCSLRALIRQKAMVQDFTTGHIEATSTAPVPRQTQYVGVRKTSVPYQAMTTPAQVPEAVRPDKIAAQYGSEKSGNQLQMAPQQIQETGSELHASPSPAIFISKRGQESIGSKSDGQEKSTSKTEYAKPTDPSLSSMNPEHTSPDRISHIRMALAPTPQSQATLSSSQKISPPQTESAPEAEQAAEEDLSVESVPEQQTHPAQILPVPSNGGNQTPQKHLHRFSPIALSRALLNLMR